MTYSLALHGLGATGDRFAIGQEVTARFIPRGVNAANQAGVFAALDAAMAQTGVFRSPSYRGWGSGANAGLVVFKAYTKTDAYTAQQVADMMKSVVAATTRTLGVVRLATSTITHPTPHGPAVAPAAAPPAAPPPGGAGPAEPPPAYAPPAADDGSAAESPGFFTRKVGGVPVWGIGAGIGTLGVVAIGAALLMRKKPAPVALAKNAPKRAGFTTKQLSRMALDAAVAEYMRHAHGVTPAEARERIKRLLTTSGLSLDEWRDLVRKTNRSAGIGPRSSQRPLEPLLDERLDKERDRELDIEALAAARREMAMNPGWRRYRG